MGLRSGGAKEMGRRGEVTSVAASLLKPWYDAFDLDC